MLNYVVSRHETKYVLLIQCPGSIYGNGVRHIMWMMTERILNGVELLDHGDGSILEQIEKQSATIQNALAEAKKLDNNGEMHRRLEQVEKAAAEHQRGFDRTLRMESVREMEHKNSPFPGSRFHPACMRA